MKIYTIGFTQTTAENFFRRLLDVDVRRVIDVRLNNTSQLAGFAKAKDLKYFLKALASIDYLHEPLLAPTQAILDSYKKKKGSWEEYEERFLDLMDERKIDERLEPGLFDKGCLLCSEAQYHHCHRRLVAKFLNERWGQVIEVSHL